MPLDKETLHKILLVFQDELAKHVDTLTQCLVLLENPKTDSQQFSDELNKLLRVVHTIKGSARSLDLTEIANLAHQFETLFAPVRDNPLCVPEDVATICFKTLDAMKEIVQARINDKPVELDFTKLFDNLKQAEKIYLGSESDVLITDTGVKSQPDEKEVVSSQESIRLSVENINQLTHFSNDLMSLSFDCEKSQQKLFNLSRALLKINKAFSMIEDNYSTLSSIQFAKQLKVFQRDSANILYDFNASFYNQTYLQKHLTLLADQMQDQLQTIRLAPVHELLTPLLRVARDISSELKKPVEVNIEGGEMEVDRLILQAIKAHLIQLIRNAIDHGIESKSVREMWLKPTKGQITIQSRLEGGRFILKVADDGAGLELDKIKQTALAKNLITEMSLAILDETSIKNLIFRPGFSTRENVSEISGRGVGLDLVRNQVAGVQGGVSVESTPGLGICFTLDLPTSLSVNRGLVIKCCDDEFVLQSSVIEMILPFDANLVRELQGHPVYQFQGEALGMYLLQDLLAIKRRHADNKNPYVIIVSVSEGKYALLVDDVLNEGRLIVEPLLPPFSLLKGILGGCLIHKNRLSLVLNPEQLLNHT